MANGHGILNGGGSDWSSLKSWAQAIGFVGIPGAIAVYVVLVGSQWLPDIVREQQATRQEMKQTREQVSELVALTNSLIRISQRACSNAAKDDHARQRCFDQ